MSLLLVTKIHFFISTLNYLRCKLCVPKFVLETYKRFSEPTTYIDTKHNLPSTRIK